MDFVKEYVVNTKAQAHLCILNNDLFDICLEHGVYGFPHQGESKNKSFWRAVASMYNIGPNDLIFLYRTNGNMAGCKEIHGPFKIHCIDNEPSIYYDLHSEDMDIIIPSGAECKVRLLFEEFDKKVYSIGDNYELIKRYETKKIWGYRHPAVMNIGAARKKSVTSFSHKQTIELLDLLSKNGIVRNELAHTLPSDMRLSYLKKLKKDYDEKHFILNDEFLLTQNTKDEAYLYAYINRGLKTSTSKLHKRILSDFSTINDEMILETSGKTFKDLTVNVMTEVVISPHLQDEIDILIMDVDDKNMLFMEFKEGNIDQEAVNQAEKYIDLLQVIFPDRNVYANIIGKNKDPFTKINRFRDRIKLVKYKKRPDGYISFTLF
jgi:hypothetical protein